MGNVLKTFAVQSIIISTIILILSQSVNSTTIHGNVYDYSLELSLNAIIKVNTTPEQTFITKEGTYSFDLPLGTYLITASMDSIIGKYYVEQIVNVIGEGDFIIDLIMFPDISDQENLDSPRINLDDTIGEKSTISLYFQMIILSLVIVGAIIIVIIINQLKQLKKNPNTSHSNIIDMKDNLPEQIISHLKANGGRMYQKDIRKLFPFSEAKISLVLLEMEHNNLIKKIKKGKGNIIILNE